VKKQDISVDALIKMVEAGELQLPEIQRQYVWRVPRVRDLLDSLYRGYPTGSILVWETNEPIPTIASAVEQTSSAFEGKKLLLDGQQRLTSLAAVLRGKPVTVRGRKRPIDILSNHDHPDIIEFTEVESDTDHPLFDDSAADENDSDEEGQDQQELALTERLNRRTFVVASKSLEKLPNWVRVTDVFTRPDSAILKRAGVTSFEDERYERYTARLKRLRSVADYMYVMHVLEKEKLYEEVAEIFVRVNSLGMKLRSSDLALAQISARWRKVHADFDAFIAEAEENWYTLDPGLLVRAMVVFASEHCEFSVVGNLKIERLKKGWEQAKEGLRFAINFLRTNAGIEDETLLSSPFLIIPVAVFGQIRDNHITKEESRQLLYWLLVANTKARYSRGSSETLLNEDLNILFSDGSPEDLLRPMERQFGRFTVESSDLANRGSRSPLFSMAYLALRAAGAKDWCSGLGLSLTHQGKLHFIQYHHIFPRARLRRHETGFASGEVNEIANLAFISGQTNWSLGAKLPEDYFPEVIAQRGEDALTSQCIPLGPELRQIGSFRQFLEVRRGMLADALNAHISRALET